METYLPSKDAFNELDLNDWLKSPCWRWFKSVCAQEAKNAANVTLDLDPATQATEIARAQGRHQVHAGISGGIPVEGGQILHFEQHLMETLREEKRERTLGQE